MAKIDPLDLLAFIASGSSMTTEQIARRWPEWAKRSDAAYKRYDRESAAYRTKWGYQARGTNDPKVDSLAGAQRYWVHLPLIRACLEQNQPDILS
ncbi:MULTISPECIES: hypothetical protein [Sphingomonadaceae]|jgi:hypothetical protein|uniref:Uncharacterized protein n=2 Tax=Sphingobium TaxID=165695 RepID=A0A249MZS7_SPHXE|nr:MULTISPECIES: hypothetical protein [Sphingomonadaceae]MBD3814235.1 hypothetical protein [Betaproteobacteria bacterium]MBJ7439461.1 hypothetical protein [Sphingopyxis sp.]TNE44996.1 MAG: hypothetical protein EP345_02095 [Sphingomonadales bacterium]HWH18453.1 hypothetical protein [Allosphingosinicella sp.]ASY46818.1 hypothetical protein CJD35_20225 [Sphingobium xenophagum]|tara:strand:+ start:15484 stop:15768 length:285 start_codon:yes stop_codon:yes gene_type:complete